VQVSTLFGWRSFQFILDSGADFTMLPEALAGLVGVDLSQCPKQYTSGIEERPLPVRVGSITIRLGPDIIPLRCHFMKMETAPYLLGRMDFFSRYNIFFQNDRRRVIFERID